MGGEESCADGGGSDHHDRNSDSSDEGEKETKSQIVPSYSWVSDLAKGLRDVTDGIDRNFG